MTPSTKMYSENPYPGRLVVVEGPDGVGKSTMVDALVAELRAQSAIFTSADTVGFEVLKTRVPGGSPAAEKIREIILNLEIDDVTELTLMALTHRLYLQQTVIPALERGAVVVSDRNTLSLLAYQGYGRRQEDKVRDVMTQLIPVIVPDQLLLLVASDTVLERRAQARGAALDRIESNNELQGRVRSAYRAFSGHKQTRYGFNTVIARVPDGDLSVYADYAKKSVDHLFNDSFVPVDSAAYDTPTYF